VTEAWPLFDLRLRLGDLLLRPVTEADLPLLVAIVPEDLEVDPSLPNDRTLAVCQGYWRAQSHWSAEDWALSFLVREREQAVGVQVLEGADFPLLRTVDSASWLVPSARGRGIGKAMRAAVLDFAFGSLRAQAAVTSAWHDNEASLGVSRSLGYLPNGEHWRRRGDRADVMVHLRMSRSEWPGSGVVVNNFEECRHLFGV
jgi:RimJ/RimL family protein N-acetyltransferase